MTEVKRTTRGVSVGLILCCISALRVLGSASVTLAWDPSPDLDVAGYRVYVGQFSGVYAPPIDVGSQTTVVVSNLQQGVTHYFVVTAYNSSGLESDPSNEIHYTPPIVTGPTELSAPVITTPRLSSAPPMAFVAIVDGPPNRIYRIEVSEDLKIWTPLQTLTSATGSVHIVDEDAVSHERRFYRVIMNRPTIGGGYTNSLPPSSSSP
jgi:hypothetical protein